VYRRTAPLACVLLLVSTLTAAAADKAAALFGPDKVWTAHLEISSEGWDAMHPTRGVGLFGVPAPPPGKDKDQPPGPPRGGFGFDFEYVKGQFSFDGRAHKDVGVRFKGNSSYAVTAQGLKRPFKLDFDRFAAGTDFHGLKTINLANNAMDPTQLRESLAYSVFRAAGVPAPRTAFVALTLTVPGRYDKEFLGLYTLIEEVDRSFLGNHFKSGKGLLVKPEGIQGLPYLGRDWKPYQDRYRPKKEPDAREKERLVEFTRLINFADDAEFNKGVGQFLDVDEFLRYLAACSAMVNLDSFVAIGHNYYLYMNPADDRFVIIPWDLNHTFGGLSMAGAADQQMDWAIRRPYLGSNRLVERILAVKEHEDAYRKHLRQLAEKAFTAEKLLAEIELMQKAVRETTEQEAKSRKNDPTGGLALMLAVFGGAPPDLKKFVTKRAESLAAQLEGKSAGKDIAWSFGGRAAGQGLGNRVVKPVLEAGDADKDGKLSWAEATAVLRRLVQECDGEKKGAVNEKALAEGVNRLMPPRPAGWFSRPTPPNPAVGPGVSLAGFAFVRAGVKEDRLKADDLVAVAEKLFQGADRNKDGSLDDKELIEGLNALPAAAVIMAPPAAPPPKKPEPR
jgi:hypothetical protein